MHIETVFRAEIQGGTSGEGLSVGVVDGEQIVVVIELEHRRRAVTLDRAGALKMAAAISTALEGERLAA